MHGPLDEIGLIEVLQLLERGRRSGTLRIVSPGNDQQARIHIAEGRIVALEPAASDAVTIDTLVLRSLIAPNDAHDDPSLLATPLFATVRKQLALQALAVMLHWQRGRFDFTGAATMTGPLALSPETIIMDLVAAEGQRLELASVLHEFRAIPDFTADDRLAADGGCELTPRDWRVLDQVDGTRDVAAIAAAIGEPLQEVAMSVRALEAAAILELHLPAQDAAQGARAAVEGGRYEDAASMWRTRLAQRPDDVDAWRALGLAEVGAGRFEQAIDAWQSWRDADPAHAADALALMQAARTMVEALRDARD